MSVNLFFMKKLSLGLDHRITSTCLFSKRWMSTEGYKSSQGRGSRRDVMLTDWCVGGNRRLSGPVFIGTWELWSLVISWVLLRSADVPVVNRVAVLPKRFTRRSEKRQKDATTACPGEKYEAIGGWRGKKWKFGSDNLWIIKWVKIRIVTWVKGLAMNATLFIFQGRNQW